MCERMETRTVYVYPLLAVYIFVVYYVWGVYILYFVYDSLRSSLVIVFNQVELCKAKTVIDPILLEERRPIVLLEFFAETFLIFLEFF